MTFVVMDKPPELHELENILEIHLWQLFMSDGQGSGGRSRD